MAPFDQGGQRRQVPATGADGNRRTSPDDHLPMDPSIAPPDPAPRRRLPSGVPLILVGAVLLLIVLAVALLVRDGDGPERGRDGGGPSPSGEYQGREVEPPTPRPSFTLTTTDGKPFDFQAETQGRFTLLFFGYTNCPDICPLHLANLSYVFDRPDMPKPDPLVVFVGTDPARDTPEAVRRFLDQWDRNFIGLTGTEEELRVAQEAAGVTPAVAETPKSDSDNYQVGHATQVIAYTADDLSHVVYPFGTRQQDWIADLPKLAAIGAAGR